MAPYYSDTFVTLYHGRMEDALVGLGEFDACITDPPYGVTALDWDRWVDGWPLLVAGHTNGLWCFGALRMFMDHAEDFKGWKLSHDMVGQFEVDTMVWEKHNGTGFASDRLKCVHELGAHFYQGRWSDIYHEAPREAYHGPDKHARARDSRTPHTGAIGGHHYEDDGRRMVRSVIKHQSIRGGIHATQKPVPVIAPLIEYAVPPGGVLLDPFAGSCSISLAGRQLGRRSVAIEADEARCEAAARRLSVPDLFGGAA